MRVRQTPLNLELTLRKDTANTKEIRGLINLRLIDSAGMEWRSNIASVGEEMVYSFQPNYFAQSKRLTLKADGLYMYNKGKKIVIDTQKRIVLEAPDSRLRLDSPNPALQQDGKDFWILAVTAENLDSIDSQNQGYNLLSETFEDGAGTKHQLVDVGDGYVQYSGAYGRKQNDPILADATPEVSATANL